MVRPFSQATAEQVVVTCEAVVALGDGVDANAIAAFADLPAQLTQKALALAVDLGLLRENAGVYSVANALCRLFRTPQDREKAAILRITIESYEPFLVFREELQATNDTSTAANRTKARLDLDCHREEVKDTLLNLATYSGALKVAQGNRYERDQTGTTALLEELALGSTEEADAVHTIRKELGDDAANVVDHAQIIVPLAAGLRHAAGGAGREAVLHAGNAIDTFLDWYAADRGVALAGATGINGKVEKLRQGGAMPVKIQNVSKYLGHVRNAADHGNDADVGAPWNITAETGRNYIFVAAGFIRSIISHRSGHHFV